MQGTQSKITSFSLLVSVTGTKITKTETSFLEVQYNCIHSGLFYYNCSTLFGLNYILPCLNNFDFYHGFFLLVLFNLIALTLMVGVELF